eukprot:gene29391-36603_t
MLEEEQRQQEQLERVPEVPANAPPVWGGSRPPVTPAGAPVMEEEDDEGLFWDFAPPLAV